MKTVFFIWAILFFAKSAQSQDFFDSPIHRSNLAQIEPYEWSTVDDNDHVVIMRGQKNVMHEYSLEFLDWLGAEPGEKEYYVVLNTGVPIKVSLVETKGDMWIFVDYKIKKELLEELK